MYDVLLALAPAALFGIFNFGIRALVLIVVCMASCVLSEYIWQKAMGLPLTVSDGSAALTGLFLALNLSSKFPIWMAIVGICHYHRQAAFWRTGTELYEPCTWCKMFPDDFLRRTDDLLCL